MLLMIDNYDSFTYNLVQYFGELGQEVKVYRNDEIGLEDIPKLSPQMIVLSPGPCTPREAGVCVPLVQKFVGHYPILGVCLGHQSIAYAFGATVSHAKRLMHGKTDTLLHDGSGLFTNIPPQPAVARYHSLAVEAATLPKDFVVNATALSDDSVMAFYHRKYPLYGLQFHPESVATEHGKTMLQNFLEKVRER